jgi:hypothetical protein
LDRQLSAAAAFNDLKGNVFGKNQQSCQVAPWIVSATLIEDKIEHGRGKGLGHAAGVETTDEHRNLVYSV